jgi:hypothetical protein
MRLNVHESLGRRHKPIEFDHALILGAPEKGSFLQVEICELIKHFE